MTIEFYVKNIYGNETMYINDSVQAEAVQKITAQKTLTTATMQGLEALGFSFKEVIAPRSTK